MRRGVVLVMLALVVGALLIGCRREVRCWNVEVARFVADPVSGEVVRVAPGWKTICK